MELGGQLSPGGTFRRLSASSGEPEYLSTAHPGSIEEQADRFGGLLPTAEAFSELLKYHDKTTAPPPPPLRSPAQVNVPVFLTLMVKSLDDGENGELALNGTIVHRSVFFDMLRLRPDAGTLGPRVQGAPQRRPRGGGLIAGASACSARCSSTAAARGGRAARAPSDFRARCTTASFGCRCTPRRAARAALRDLRRDDPARARASSAGALGAGGRRVRHRAQAAAQAAHRARSTRTARATRARARGRRGHRRRRDAAARRRAARRAPAALRRRHRRVVPRLGVSVFDRIACSVRCAPHRGLHEGELAAVRVPARPALPPRGRAQHRVRARLGERARQHARLRHYQREPVRRNRPQLQARRGQHAGGLLAQDPAHVVYRERLDAGLL